MYIAAGLFTIINSIEKILGREYAEESFTNFCNNNLISYGLNLNKNKRFIDPIEYAEKFLKNFDKVSEYKNITNMLDSGGYQVSTGWIHIDDLDAFIDSYIYFLVKYSNLYDTAFTLDMPIAVGDKYFDSDKIYELNKKSLSKTIELPQEIKDKILLVVHGRILPLYYIWRKLIYEDEYISHFKRFSIGGLVVAGNVVKNMPISLYSILMLMPILYFSNKNLKPDPFQLHVLGISNHRDVFFFYLLKEAIEDTFGLNVQLSYDSSNIFKKLLQARFFSYFDEKTLCSYDVSIKFKDLDNFFREKNILIRDLVLSEITNMANIIKYDKIDNLTNLIYTTKNSSFDSNTSAFIMLLEAYEQTKFDNAISLVAKEMYHLYKTDEIKFIKELSNQLTKLNSNKLTRTVKKYTSTFKNSLDLIRSFEHKSIKDLDNVVNTYCIGTDSETFSIPSFWHDI